MTDFDDAIAAWKAGGLVAFPTETVYGLGADADNPAALQRLLHVKRRPANKPITVHLGPSADPEAWGHFSPGASKLASTFWPGPLTLIVPRRSRVPAAVTAGKDSVGLRVPSHPVASALLDAFGGGVAASSANRAGEPPPTAAAQVVRTLGNQVDVVVAGQTDPAGLASTVLLLAGSPVILRQGALGREQLQEVLGMAIAPEVT